MKDQGKLVEGGRFRVFIDGTVHRIKNGTEKVATQSVLKLKSGNFLITSYTENGKQKHFYVSRLIAEAYIHPLEKGQIVCYRDGDRLNVNASNLYIANKSEVSREAIKKTHEKRWKHFGHACPRCGKMTVSKGRLCADCRLELKTERMHEHNVAKKKLTIAEELAVINPSLLTDTENQIIALRRSGEAYEEISKKLGLGITRERIRQIINKCIVISKRGYRRKKPAYSTPYRKTSQDSIEDLEAKIRKTEARLLHYKEWLKNKKEKGYTSQQERRKCHGNDVED
ncbi:MAG: HNH endonuclease [Lacticaseibacillus paracasei]